MPTPRETFLHHMAQTSPEPFGIEVDRAEGSVIYDKQGRAYIDMISGIGVSNIGHRHPHVLRAIQQQLDRHLHVMVYGEYIQDAPVRLAAKLTTLLPPSLSSVYFVNSGTEANEAALKLAKRVTGRFEIVACHKSYHGSTHGSLSVSGNETKKQSFRPLLPGITFIEFNNPDQLSVINQQTAAVIIETIQGDAGVRIPDAAWIQKLRKRCTETGALLIMDEIQCGMGRTGKWFAFEHFNIHPDILTIAKAFGGGLPIGAFISSHDHMKMLTYDPPLGHITTFGGNPVCCASALATLEVIENENLLAGVESKGMWIEKNLKHPSIKEIRRIGLMFAIDFESPDTVNQIVSYAREHGVICYWFLSHPSSFRMAPPLNITQSEIERACAVILDAIHAVSKAGK